MSHSNYLSSHRLRWALTKTELAHLIGYRRSGAVSRCETAVRMPTIRFVLACEVIFGEPPRRLFPSLYAAVEETVMARAAFLDINIRDRFDAVAVRKRELLKLMADRADNRPLL